VSVRTFIPKEFSSELRAAGFKIISAHSNPRPWLPIGNRMSRFLVLTVFVAFSFACLALVAAGELEPILGKKGRLLLAEEFEGQSLPKGWIVKAGKLRVADGTLRASQDREAGKLGLFSREQPMQDAVIQIDFKFDGARGINVSVNPSPATPSEIPRELGVVFLADVPSIASAARLRCLPRRSLQHTDFLHSMQGLDEGAGASNKA